ncbi:class I SAM-dependent methyltransferase [Pseudodonghicola flavimaris]|uniref:Methyltransferase domain-containing protein n=1 Tax=Pseudodonghicola flavimaris TaxID=3050036 RepID=A0ABT7F5N7_9RHOB|nr:methyltransferase domain-containing protein [Pseudodonghicola flavimaris]MDK3019923.1 methyltransferase domain-containing protein [Pseudodonghicola flavimaris]
MHDTDASAAATFADRYQSVLVPVIFEPWAEEMVRRADPQPGEHILDLACGTGVVTRRLLAQAVRPGRLAAVDHSADMLAVAGRLSPAAEPPVEWIEADAARLPFADDSFDLALCQQALQFFPDRAAALSDLHRVLKPTGRAIFCVQRDLAVNPMLAAQASALETCVGPEAGAAVRAICGLPQADVLQRLFAAAGFRDIRIDSVSLTLSHPNARAFAAGAMGGMHTGDKLSGLSETRIEQAIEAFLAALGPCYDGTAMTFPHVSHVVEARA